MGGNTPAHDREVIRHPAGDEIARRFLNLLAPALPVIKPASIETQGAELKLTRRTFFVSALDVRALKEGAVRRSTGSLRRPPSTFAVLSAHAWINFLRAKDVAGHVHTRLCFLVDCRGHLNPPTGEDYSGNCVVGSQAMAKTSQLLAEDGLAHACAAIRRAIDERIEDPLRGCEDWAEEMVTATTSIMVNVVASPRFRVYDVAHFGWGSPENVGLVSANHEGEFVLSLVLRRSCKVNMEVFVMEFGTN